MFKLNAFNGFKKRAIYSTLTLVSFFTSVSVSSDVFISEIHYDNTGSDVGEAIEISGDLATSLVGWNVVLYNGANGSSYNTIALADVTADVSCGASGGTLVLNFPSNGIQNGAPDGIALVDAGGSVVEFLSYEGTLTAADGPAASMTSTDIGVSETSSTALGDSLQLVDGVWTAPAASTFGTCTTEVSGSVGPGPGPAPMVFIHDIQGNPATYQTNSFGETDVSPLEGQTVVIEGIVIGDFQNGDADSGRELNGFFVQEERSDEDADPTSSEGIFVFDSTFGVDVNVGDLVRVQGTVDQFFGETQIDTVTEVTVISSGNLALVSAASISLFAGTDTTLSQGGRIQPDLESYEGMLVNIVEQLTITEQFQLDRFNEVTLVAGERPFQFTQINVPDVTGFAAAQEALGVRRMTYDDGLSVQTTDISNLDGFAIYDETSAKRMGDTVDNLTGVLDYKWAGASASGATWRVRSHIDGTNIFTSTLDGNSPNPRPLVPEDVGGTLKVASFNVLNFFTTLDESGVVTAIGMDPRGADTPEEFARQVAKTVNALALLDADVLGLVEIENEFDAVNDGSTAIEVLVNELNAVVGAGTYDYVYPGQQFVGTDAISVGFIYKPAVVELAEGSSVALIDDAVAATLDVFSGRDFVANPIFNGPSTNRVSMAASFTHLESGDSFTVVANHFKSKGPSGLSDTASPNFDQMDGAGFWNQRRLDGAVAIAEWLQTLPTGLDDEDIIILGDLNAYAMEDPVQYLLANGYNNVEDAGAYSFVFDGQMGTLDYVLLSDALYSKLTGESVWHINADEADALDYNLDFGRLDTYFDVTTATRNSDHDPLFVGLNLLPELTTIVDVIYAFNAGVKAGEIDGTGRHGFRRFINRYTFGSILYKAKHAESKGKITRACRRLRRADRFSDGAHRDLIEGLGVPALNAMIEQAAADLRCTH